MELTNKLYVGLGVPSIVSTTPYSDWYAYTPDTNAWERKAEFPGGRAQAWSFTVGEDVYVGGGADSTNYAFPVSPVVPNISASAMRVAFSPTTTASAWINRVNITDIAVGDANYWSTFMEFSNPIFWGNYMSLIGGFPIVSSVVAAQYNKGLFYTVGGKWAVLTNENSGYQTATSQGVSPYGQYTFYAHKTYVFSTLNAANAWYNYYGSSTAPVTDNTKSFKDFWKYSSKYNTWTNIPNQPATISESAWSKSLGFTINNTGYILNEVSGETFKYTPLSNTWNQVACYPEKNKRFYNKFVIGTIPYIGGGATGGNYYKGWYSYNYLTDTWSSIATFIGTGQTGANSFSASGRGYVVGGYGGTYLKNNYEYIPSANGWTTAPTYIGTAGFFGVGLSTEDAGYAMLGANGNTAFIQNNKFTKTGSWQNKTNFIGTARLFSTAETVVQTTYNNYIYYTTGSMSACATICNLWAIKVTNFDDVFAPTVIGAIPISTSVYWKALDSIPAKYNNSYYPMDIVANNNYVIVTQWHYPTGSNDVASGSNFINIGIRASIGNPFISTWYPQTLYYDQYHNSMFPPGLTFISNTASNSFIAHGINDIIIKECIVNTNTVGTTPHLIFPNYKEINFVATQYNVASYGVKNALGRNSDISKIADNVLYITPTAFPLSVSQKYPANTTIIDDTANTETLINNSLYWTQRIKDGE